MDITLNMTDVDMVDLLDELTYRLLANADSRAQARNRAAISATGRSSKQHGSTPAGACGSTTPPWWPRPWRQRRTTHGQPTSRPPERDR